MSAQPQFGEMISGYPQETWAPTWKWEKNLKKKKQKKKKQECITRVTLHRKLLNNSADKVWAREEFISLSQSSAGVTGV